MENKQFLDCKLTEIKVNDFSDEYFTFEGYASTFGNVDRGNDVVVKGAFSDSIIDMRSNVVPIKGTQYSKMMPVLWQHNWGEPIGSFIEMREDAKGLFVKAILPKDDAFVRDRVIPQMKVGSISDMSIGYIVDKQSFDGDIRKIEKATLFETSLVTIPMNADAVVTGFKSISDDLPIASKDAVWNSDNEAGASIDGEELKVNITCEVDGVETVIPFALFKAARDINANPDMEAAKPDIEKYYKAMGMESPFKEQKAFRVDDIKSVSERELETLLRSGVCFSQKQAKAIVSLLNDEAQRDVDAKSQRDAELKAELTKLLNTL